MADYWSRLVPKLLYVLKYMPVTILLVKQYESNAVYASSVLFSMVESTMAGLLVPQAAGTALTVIEFAVNSVLGYQLGVRGVHHVVGLMACSVMPRLFLCIRLRRMLFCGVDTPQCNAKQ